jgi:hypothetical protein
MACENTGSCIQLIYRRRMPQLEIVSDQQRATRTQVENSRNREYSENRAERGVGLVQKKDKYIFKYTGLSQR